MTRFDRTPEKTDRARRLRMDATTAERVLWSKLRGRQIEGESFRRQHPIGSYVLDFYCAPLRLAIEVDGNQHGFPGHAKRDALRDARLRDVGVVVLRFSNSDVLGNLNGVAEQVRLAVLTARNDGASSPSLAREGRMSAGHPGRGRPSPPQKRPPPGRLRRPTSPFQGEGKSAVRQRTRGRDDG